MKAHVGVDADSDRPGTHGGMHSRKCVRCHSDQAVAARRGSGRVRRCGLHQCAQACRVARQGTRRANRRQSWFDQEAARRKPLSHGPRGAGEGEGQHACEGGASVPCGEESVPSSQGTIQGIGKERSAALHAVRVGESAAGAQAFCRREQERGALKMENRKKTSRCGVNRD